MAYKETSVPTIWNTKLTANDSTAKETLGVIRVLDDGRAFRYIKMTGGALAMGQLAKPAAAVAITNLTAASGNGPDGATTTIITDTGATMTADQYKDWFFKCDTGMTGSTEAIKIVGNTATTLTLEKSITTTLAVGGTDDGEILPPPGVCIISAVTDASQPCSGVGVGTITQNYHGWVQVRGFGNVLGTAALTETQPITPGGAATAGQAADGSAATDNVIGICIAAGGANEYNLVDLKIA